jgi:acetoacetyl-CoA reductase/3-oxoacyl-[acyl-carrier protein] reductase
MGLKDKVALVSGSSRGIGRSIALSLARQGAWVAITYLENQHLAEEVAEVIRTGGGRTMSVQLAQESRVSVQAAFRRVREELGEIEILVNNAAKAQEKPFEQITDEDWGSMMAVNLQGPFICAQEVIPGMVKKGWGRVINISSVGGQWGGFNQVHYAASKAGLINLTRSLAKIYGPHGVNSNAVAVGLVETDMSEMELASEAGRRKVASIPVGRVGKPEEVASVVAFLASDEAGYVNGQTINVNGGMYLG